MMNFRIEVFKGKTKWHWHVIARNGEIMVSSQAYSTKWSAKRSATKLAKMNGFALRVQ